MDDSPQHFLDELLKLRDQHARAALETPKDKTAFGYGEAAGTYKGLALAVELIEGKIETMARDAQSLEEDN